MSWWGRPLTWAHTHAPRSSRSHSLIGIALVELAEHAVVLVSTRGGQAVVLAVTYAVVVVVLALELHSLFNLRSTQAARPNDSRWDRVAR
jgi:hypothetical protein